MFRCLRKYFENLSPLKKSLYEKNFGAYLTDNENKFGDFEGWKAGLTHKDFGENLKILCKEFFVKDIAEY